MSFSTCMAAVIAALALIVLIPPQTDAKGLRMRVLGAGAGRTGSSHNKPWNNNNRNTFNEMRWDDDFEFGEGEDEPANFPCVGLCYYLKLERLKKRKMSMEKRAQMGKSALKTKTRPPGPPPTPAMSYYRMMYSTEEPCVGICYHFKKLGLPNPYPDH